MTTSPPRALAIDVGSTSVRTALVDTQGRVTHVRQRRLEVNRPNPGEVELDADEIVATVIALGRQTLRDGGPAQALGITNQRATTVVFDRVRGTPIGPALSWQDLRTVLACLSLQGAGLRLAPNQSATKAAYLVQASGREPDRLAMATIDTWIAWRLTEGRTFVTDRSNAALTGLVSPPDFDWDPDVARLVGLQGVGLAAIVDSVGAVGTATALDDLPITALLGDQPASLLGQSIVDEGTKITFGTGAMLNLVGGIAPPTEMVRYPSGCFPVVVRSQEGRATWGLEGIVLSAGAALEALRDGLGLFSSIDDLEGLAASAPSSGGVVFVPADLGLGTPHWDFGARSAFFGLSQATTRAHLARAALEGVAHRGADLVEAAEAQTGRPIASVRIDGGMSANGLFVQCLADALGTPVEVSSEREATTRGIGLLALVGIGALDLSTVAGLWRPARRVEPRLEASARATQRESWRWAISHVRRTIPELSEIDF